MAIMRTLAGMTLLAAFAASPAAAKPPLDIVQAATQAEPAKAAPKQPHAATKKRTPQVKPRVRSAGKAKPHTVARRVSPPQNASAEEESHVMRGPDTVALVAMLPWWRSGPTQQIAYGTEAANSKVMAATDAWLVQQGTSLGEMTGDATAMAQAEDASFQAAVADSETLNEIDLAAGPASPPERTFIQSLIAVLGGALAAAAAGRLLFV